MQKSANYRMYRLPDTVGRRIRQLDDQTTPARASPDRRTKSLVSVSMAVVATVSALVLGLLISNANTSFRALGAT
jgi:hypothetical protein